MNKKWVEGIRIVRTCAFSSLIYFETISKKINPIRHCHLRFERAYVLKSHHVFPHSGGRSNGGKEFYYGHVMSHAYAFGASCWSCLRAFCGWTGDLSIELLAYESWPWQRPSLGTMKKVNYWLIASVHACTSFICDRECMRSTIIAVDLPHFLSTCSSSWQTF